MISARCCLLYDMCREHDHTGLADVNAALTNRFCLALRSGGTVPWGYASRDEWGKSSGKT